MSEQLNNEDIISKNPASNTVSDDYSHQSLEESQIDSNSFNYNLNTTTFNSPQSPNQTENADNNNLIIQDSFQANSNNNNNNNENGRSKEILNSSSSLFEFPTDLKPSEKKEDLSFFGGFLDQTTNNSSNHEKNDSNNKLNGLFNEIQAKDDTSNNTPENENTNPSKFSFPASDYEKGKKENEGFNFFGGFTDQTQENNSINTDHSEVSNGAKENPSPTISSTQEQPNDVFKEQNSDASNMFTFSDSSKEISKQEQTNNDMEEQNTLKEDEKKEERVDSDFGEFKFSGYDSSNPNSSGFGFDFNSGIVSSDGNNSSFSFNFDFSENKNDQNVNDDHKNSSNDFTFVSNHPIVPQSDDKLSSSNEEKKSSNFTFDPFNSKLSSSSNELDSSSSKIKEFAEALNSPVFEEGSNESFKSFFNKKDIGDSLEAAYNLLFSDLSSN